MGYNLLGGIPDYYSRCKSRLAAAFNMWLRMRPPLYETQDDQDKYLQDQMISM